MFIKYIVSIIGIFLPGVVFASADIIPVLSHTPTKTYTVISCNDGDTCRIKNSEGEILKLRLAAIDAPEMSKGGQPYGQQAKDFLNTAVQNKAVNLVLYTKDFYGRELGEIYLNSTNINVSIVAAGLAELYQGRPPKGLDLSPYQAAQNNAQIKKINIWSQKNYQSPKAFRKSKKH